LKWTTSVNTKFEETWQTILELFEENDIEEEDLEQIFLAIKRPCWRNVIPHDIF